MTTFSQATTTDDALAILRDLMDSEAPVVTIAAEPVRIDRSPRYIDTADTAKMLRAALKAAFPSVKFSVRSNRYSGGSSIDVSWTDGPRTKVVDAVAQQFAGATFDGMTDCKNYHRSVTADGEVVRFGADFVFCSRTVSNFAEREAAALEHIRANCVLEADGQRFGNDWIDTLSQRMAHDFDPADGADALVKAFRRVVLREEN